MRKYFSFLILIVACSTPDDSPTSQTEINTLDFTMLLPLDDGKESYLTYLIPDESKENDELDMLTVNYDKKFDLFDIYLLRQQYIYLLNNNGTEINLGFAPGDTSYDPLSEQYSDQWQLIKSTIKPEGDTPITIKKKPSPDCSDNILNCVDG